jgi:hypothetical protein
MDVPGMAEANLGVSEMNPASVYSVRLNNGTASASVTTAKIDR